MNILAIGCHPDDLEIGCGGTLAKYSKSGHQVFMCNIASGDLGHKSISPKELKVIRNEEAKRAAQILGAEHISLQEDDLSVESANKALRLRLIEIIRYTKADLIITHNPDDYMRDHTETCSLSIDASFAATIPNLITCSDFITEVPQIYFMDSLAGINFIPTEYVDITSEIEQKLQALSCHESQIKWLLEHDHIDFLDFVKTSNKYRGIQSNVKFAEGFRQYNAWPRNKTYRVLP